LKVEGLIYDLERQAIIGLLPRDGLLVVLAMGLEATKMWEQRDSGLWLREEYWPPLVPVSPRLPPPQQPSMTPAQQERAIMLIRQGMSLREVAKLFDTSHQSVHRLMKKAIAVEQPE
jgi:site-specific DNA recombinase